MKLDELIEEEIKRTFPDLTDVGTISDAKLSAYQDVLKSVKFFDFDSSISFERWCRIVIRGTLLK